MRWKMATTEVEMDVVVLVPKADPVRVAFKDKMDVVPALKKMESMMDTMRFFPEDLVKTTAMTAPKTHLTSEKTIELEATGMVVIVVMLTNVAIFRPSEPAESTKCPTFQQQYL